MKRVILLIGIPASGKTTLAKKMVERGYTSINADSIRAELYGDAAMQGSSQEVFALFFSRLEALFAAGADVIVDNTNLKASYRKEIIDRARRFNYEDVQLWVMDVPLAVCMSRNANRERRVPEEILAKMHSQFTRNGRPQRSEGKLVRVQPGPNEDDFRFLAER